MSEIFLSLAIPHLNKDKTSMFFIKQELCLSCGKLYPLYCFDRFKTHIWMKTSKQKTTRLTFSSQRSSKKTESIFPAVYLKNKYVNSYQKMNMSNNTI